MTTPTSATQKTDSSTPTHTPQDPQTPQNSDNTPVHTTPTYIYLPPPQQPKQSLPPTPFSRADWIIFALAGIEALVLIIAFNVGIDKPLALPGIGLTLMFYTHLGIVALALRGKARYNRTTLFLIVATVLLGTFPAIYGNLTLRALNFFIVWILLIVTTFFMSNIWKSAKLHLTPFISAFTTFFLSIFSHIARPIDALRALSLTHHKMNPKKILPAALGVLLAGAALCIILPLLFSADVIFAQGFSDVINSIFSFSVPSFILRIITLAIAWPAFFGILWGLSRTSKPSQTIASSTSRFVQTLRLPATTALILLGTIILVYIAFIWVQAVYLFGGRASALAAGSYSEYARSGFFQLVTVAAINLAVALHATYSTHNRRETEGGLSVSPLPALFVRIGVVLLLAQTAVILASAFMRMNLYVEAYGLSLLRILTYLGMAFIAVCLLVACLYVFRQKTPVFAAIFTSGIILWAAFNLINPEYRIASYNVEHYLSGDIKDFDVHYFYNLSPGVAPVLEDLNSKIVYRDVEDVLESYRDEVEDAPWQAWSVSFLSVQR